MNKLSSIGEQVREEVGHVVRVDTIEADVLGRDRIEQVWRVLPEDPLEVHEFILWHQACDRQWFETPEEAAAAYCTKWAEWCDTQAPVVDYSADSIDFTP
jgi:hypothetical protein